MHSHKSRLRSFFAGPTARRFWLIASLLLVYTGTSYIRALEPLEKPESLLEAAVLWNKKLYLAFQHPFNRFLGLLLILTGIVAFGRSLKLHNSTRDIEKLQSPAQPEIRWQRALPWFVGSLILFALIQTQLAQHKSSALILYGWLATLTVPSLLFWLYERRAGIDLGLSISRVDGIWLFTLFGLTMAIGCFLLTDLPLWVMGDEGGFWDIARISALGELNRPLFDVGVYSFPLASSIFQGWVLRWAGINLWGWRFASVIPASLAILPFYLLVRDLFDRRVAVVSALILICNPYFISFARLGYNNSQALLPVVLCIYLTHLALQKDSKFFLWLAGLSAGFGFYTYFAAWLGLVVAGTVLSIVIMRSGGGRRKLLSYLGIFLFAWLMVTLPRILYALSGDLPESLYYKIGETTFLNPFYGRAIFGDARIAESIVLTLGNEIEILADLKLCAILLLRGLILTFAGFFDSSLYGEHFITSELAGPISSIFFALGLGLAFANLKQLRFFTIVSWFLLGSFFLGIIAAFPPRATHLIAILPAMAVFAALGLVSLIATIFPTKQPRANTIGKIVLSVTLLALSLTGLVQYFAIMPWDYSPSLDLYASWLGRRIQTPAKLIFIDAGPNAPDAKYQSDHLFSQHQIMTLKRTSLEEDPGQAQAWGGFVAFINTNDGMEFAEWLAGQIPNTKIKTAYAPVWRLRGYMVTNIEFDAEIDLSFSHGLYDLWYSPVRNILLACVAVIVILGGLELKRRPLISQGKIARPNQPSESWSDVQENEQP